MNRLRIEHRTVYTYTEPVRLGRHRFVLRPREGHQITVVEHRLAVRPAARLFWMNDVFGNHIALGDFPEETDRLEIINSITIDRLTESEDFAPSGASVLSRAALPVIYDPFEEPVARAYQIPVYPEEQIKVRDWTRGILAKTPPATALQALMTLNRAIFTGIGYRRREEPGVQSPAATLTLAAGSCRDLAVLMIEAVRGLGMAARFVSGYLDSQASAAGRGATHAWMEACLPDCGWCGFDPTLGEPVTRKQIALGVSSHPRGVMPVSGTFAGAPGTRSGMEVAISIRREEIPSAPPVER